MSGGSCSSMPTVASGASDRLAVGGLLHAGHDLEHGRLAGAVGADHADLRAGQERQGDVVEDHLVAVRLARTDHRVDVLSHWASEPSVVSRAGAGPAGPAGPAPCVLTSDPPSPGQLDVRRLSGVASYVGVHLVATASTSADVVRRPVGASARSRAARRPRASAAPRRRPTRPGRPARARSGGTRRVPRGQVRARRRRPGSAAVLRRPVLGLPLVRGAARRARSPGRPC